MCKINYYRYRYIFAFAASLFAAASAYAETFRVRKLFPVTITGTPAEEQAVTAGINDSLGVFLPEDLTYMEGLEIRMQIPESIAEWRDSVAFSIYEGIKPVPSEKIIDYTGSRLFVQPLPTSLSWTVVIPFKKANSLKDGMYTTKIDQIPDISKHFLFLRLQPAMKGIPEETQEAEISIVVKPILTNKGKLRVTTDQSASDAKTKTYALYVDDAPFESDKDGVFIDPGVHNVSLVSDFYRGEMRTVRVDQAKTTTLAIQLRSLEPTLIITAPDNTVIYLDDKPCDKIGKAFTVSEGEHKVRFLMGNYEVVRSLTIEKGRSYTASLSVDLKITEE